jgi:hypothetical protein
LQVTQEKGSNRMDPSNLGIVVAPNLFDFGEGKSGRSKKGKETEDGTRNKEGEERKGGGRRRGRGLRLRSRRRIRGGGEVGEGDGREGRGQGD